MNTLYKTENKFGSKPEHLKLQLTRKKPSKIKAT